MGDFGQMKCKNIPRVMETEPLISTTVCMAYLHLASQNKSQAGMQNGDCNVAADGSSCEIKALFFFFYHS